MTYLHNITKFPAHFFVRHLLSSGHTSICDRVFFLKFEHFKLCTFKQVKNYQNVSKYSMYVLICTYTVDILSGFGMLFFHPVVPSGRPSLHRRIVVEGVMKCVSPFWPCYDGSFETKLFSITYQDPPFNPTMVVEFYSTLLGSYIGDPKPEKEFFYWRSSILCSKILFVGYQKNCRGKLSSH